VRRSPSVAASVVAGALVLLAPAASASRAAAPPTGAALAALAAPPAYTSLASQRIYFVMPDRYANGDPSNDRGGLSGGRDATGFDPGDPGYFHGGDYRGLTGDCADPRHGLARVEELGFSAIWVTPPYGQNTVQGSSAAYHGYWPVDFTSVDPHLGTDADFGAFVACAHSLGLKVYLDVVVNHTGDVIRLPSPTYVSTPFRDCGGKAFDPARYVTAASFPCLSAATMPQVPTVPPALRDVKRPAWLNDVTRYHDRGDVDFGSCGPTCYEQGDFYGLDDLFTEQPAVVQGLADVYADWIRRYRIDGFRVDTARHVNAAFFRLWTPKILAAAREAGVADFPVFGEVTIGDATELSSYVRDRGLPSVLDFPFQAAAAGFAGGDASGLALSNRLGDDDYFRGPDGTAPTPPTFLGNHDMGRGAEQVREHSGGASGDELLRRVLLGYDVLYLLRGAPVVMYGDEVGMLGGGDKAARQDMFPTQVPDWRTQERVGSPPVGGGSSFDVASPIGAHLRALGALRDAHPALSTGGTIVRRAARDLLVVSRIDRQARREYVAAFNSGRSAVRASVQTATPSAAWRDLLGSGPGVSSDGAGRLAVVVPPLGAVLLEAGAPLPRRALPRPRLAIGPDRFTSLVALTASVKTLDPLSVAFAVRRPGSRTWQRAGVDDSPPYRTFLDPRRYRRRERISVVAVARGSDGSIRASAVRAVVVRR
jgi:glycosidase